MLVFPLAKINLGLRITNRRANGYHDLETCFLPIPLRDLLEIVPSEVLLWDECQDIPEDNLVVKAYRAVQKLVPDLSPVRFILRKVIPSGAGLGGGSSDAAYTLRLLNSLFSLGFSYDQLHALALSLGADCPFFLTDTPMSAKGIGEILEPIALDLKGLFLTLVFPNLFISTKEAYQVVTPRIPEESVAETLKRPISEWSTYLVNDFEDPLFARYPQLGDIKEMLYAAGAKYVSMSGSGSTMYALSETKLPTNTLSSLNHKIYTL